MSQHKPLVLAVDDDPGLLKLVKRALEINDYRVITASDGQSAVKLIEEENPALVLLDFMMPGLDGFQVCERTRAFSSVPIIMLTARGRPEDVTRGLNLGADDYVIKPFDTSELLARVNAVLRRTRFPDEMPQPPLVIGDLNIDFASHRVAVAGKEVLLTPIEYRVLCLLAQNAGKVITQNHLLTQVWGPGYIGDTRVLQVAMARLRKKIGDDAGEPRYIITRSGIGYMFLAST